MNDPSSIDNISPCDITLFVACYNEEEGIIPTLETIVAAMAEIGRSYDIVVIDDASRDRSVALVHEFVASHPDVPVKLVVNGVNMGLGNNFSEAAFHGGGNYYRLICGDNVESKETMISVFRHIGEADLVLPFHESTAFRGMSRRVISSLFTGLINVIGGYRIKYYNGLSITRRYDVMRWHSNSHGFGFQADLIVRLLDMGATYVEIPIQPHERQAGGSKAFTFANVCSVMHTVLDIAIRRVARIVYAKQFHNMRLQRTAITGEAQATAVETK
jgi:glycosyltransferase involved in cell wall biosynthesis